MKRTGIIVLLLLVGYGGQAQINIYSALTIPDSLKKDANIVVREESIKLVIKDKNTARYDVHQVFTLLNEQAKADLNFVQYSDKFQVLEDAEIKLYDLSGNQKSTWTKKQMNTGKYGDDLVPDGKYTYFAVNAASYPITLEINYSIKYKGIFHLPTYEFQLPWQSVQHSVFELETPSDLGVRYKLVNTDQKPKISKDGNKEIYTWESKNLKAYKLEKHSGSPNSYVPAVFIGPNKFQLDDYAGDMTSWKNYGLWFNELYAKVSGLPEARKQFYREMVKNASTDNEKATILYNYMQNNMRYVSIQLGIGGLRPFPASFVEEKKYGDCKALSNYLKSALDAVGIKSNLIIIYRDYEPKIVDEKFPMNDFNHVILCVPQAKDSIWLECTSTTLPFASLDETTLSRKGVMITDNGGVLVNTPPSNYKTNSETVNTVIDVTEEGGAKVKMNYTIFGEVRDKILMRFHDMKDDEKRKFFITNMDIKQPDNLEINNSKNKDNPYLVTAKMEYEKIYSFNAGNKLFFETRLYPIFDKEIPEYEKRMRDYYFTYPYQAMDTTIYKFPAGFSLETMPKNKSIQFPFAQFTCTYTWDAATHTLTSTTALQIKDRVIKAADYPKLLDFKKQVMADVNEKIVMKRE